MLKHIQSISVFCHCSVCWFELLFWIKLQVGTDRSRCCHTGTDYSYSRRNHSLKLGKKVGQDHGTSLQKAVVLSAERGSQRCSLNLHAVLGWTRLDSSWACKDGRLRNYYLCDPNIIPEIIRTEAYRNYINTFLIISAYGF